MRVYLSSRYDRILELAGYRSELASMGIDCSARWLDGDTAAETAANAIIDIHDIYQADVLVTFSEGKEPVSGGQRGGRHFEAGVAYETGIPVVVVGGQENVFHCLPGVITCATWREAKRLLLVMAEKQLDDRWASIVRGIR